MNILLDTHIYLWWLNDDKKLSSKAHSLIMDANEVFVSSVSIWEAAIKSQLGKLSVDMTELVDSIETEGFIELPLTANHAVEITKLPEHHQDPFDRVLIAQAIYEPLKLVTADKVVAQYSKLVELV